MLSAAEAALPRNYSYQLIYSRGRAASAALSMTFFLSWATAYTASISANSPSFKAYADVRMRVISVMPST